jgi:hypothetical protein
MTVLLGLLFLVVFVGPIVHIALLDARGQVRPFPSRGTERE